MGETLTILSNPEDTWDAYCAETPEDGRSPQGAMAFAIDRLHDVLPEIERLRSQLAKRTDALEFVRDGYDNHDVSHVDYRVRVYQVALDALSDETAPKTSVTIG